MGQKLTDVQSDKDSETTSHRRPGDMPCYGSALGTGGHTRTPMVGAAPHFQRHSKADPDLTHQVGMADYIEETGRGFQDFLAAQPEEGVSHERLWARVHRVRGAAPWGLGIERPQDIHQDRLRQKDIRSTQRLT